VAALAGVAKLWLIESTVRRLCGRLGGYVPFANDHCALKFTTFLPLIASMISPEPAKRISFAKFCNLRLITTSKTPANGAWKQQSAGSGT
jgi:hypothetical protein